MQRSSRSLHAALCAGLAGILGLAVAASCTHEQTWTNPYSRTPVDQFGMMVVNGELVDVRRQSHDQAMERSAGCIGCHEGAEDPHASKSFSMSCVDCHGGDGLATDVEAAHPHAYHPEWWPSSANPRATFSKLNKEKLDWIRFVNPGDLRVADAACGACHDDDVLNVHKSIMTTGAHFMAVAPYANGIVSNKNALFGESYSPEGVAQAIFTYPDAETGFATPPEDELARGVVPFVVPLPHFEVGQTGNVFRVFETGSRLGGVPLAFNGLPTPLIGLPDKLEDAGRPNNRQSDRGLGTLNRVDLPLLNIFKTRLNDPYLSFLGTNDNPGDYRSSGCTACHVVYANDRSPVSSGPYARFGNTGKGNAGEDPWGDAVAADPTIPQDEEGHPINHRFTRAIPSSQCMTCHHHQPNSFVNSFLGFTMWTYDADGEPMWPQEEKDPSIAEKFEVLFRNPEEAAQRGKWGDREFLDEVAKNVNPQLQHTQFADYHGHGWNFRGAFKMDRKGNMLDADGNVVPYDSDKFAGVLPELGQTPTAEEILAGAFAAPVGKAVHLLDIHAERGMHCVDCHFEQDSHGDGRLYGEYQAQVEITCQDCHGSLHDDEDPMRSSDDTADLLTSGPASGARRAASGEIIPPPDRPGAASRDDLMEGTTPWGKARFSRDGDRIVQRSMLYPDLEWDVPQVSALAGDREKSLANRAHRAVSSRGGLAHGDGKLECYSCHTSWITSCWGCHLPQQANWKSPVNRNDFKELRNYATYNPQVARDSEFLLGVAGDVKEGRIAPVRSSSALVISSMDALRRNIYGQVPPIGANGMSSQLFNTHFPHTVRTTETRQCTDCHLSTDGDNNAWMAQALLLGTGAVNFMGHNVFVAEAESGFSAVQVTEWDEPQAVRGSHLHEMAYPERYADFVDGGRELTIAREHSGANLPFMANVRSLQLRGEYLFTANGPDGFRAFDVAQVNNKDFSLKLVTSPVSPLGQDTHENTKFATSVALPTNNHISMSRKVRPENREQVYTYEGREQNLHELYRYAYVTDLEEGLLVFDVDCLSDFDPQNNFIERVATFNPDGVLDGAVFAKVAGTTVYVCCDRGLVLVDIDDPRAPRILGEIGAPHVVDPTSVDVQFRYAFVTDSEGLKVVDVTFPEQARPIPGARVDLADARHVYVAKSYAYVSGGAQGLVIVDVERPEEPYLDQVFDANGSIDDLHQTQIAMTNDTLFAYLADGENGLKVLKLVAPNDGGRSAFGFSPRPVPELIAWYDTDGPAIALSRGLERDRAVDESGNQIALFGRIGARPFTLEEMRRFFINANGAIFRLTPDGAPAEDSNAGAAGPLTDGR